MMIWFSQRGRYRRGDLWEERKALMDAWSDYATSAIRR
jgi:hypothetical protein